MKTCLACGTAYPATPEFFHRDGSSLRSKCKPCVGAYRSAYYQRHAERARLEALAYHHAHRNDILPKLRQRYRESKRERLAQEAERYRADPAFRERKKMAMRRWAEDNPNRNRANKSAWDKRNPENRRKHNAARRARRRRAWVEMVEPVDVLAKTNGVCMYCDSPISIETMHMDHDIPLSRGGLHELSNVVPACSTCNLRKGNKTGIEFISARPPFVVVGM